MHLRFPRITVLSLIILIQAVAAGAQQNFKIGKIEFEGLKRLSAEEMIASTGLKVGEPFSLDALDAAAQRLMDSGNFKNVAYKTRPNKDQLTITFQVEEVKTANSRVVFDNFIWFEDTQLLAAIKRDVPSFDGTAPDAGDTVDRISKALQRFLHENKIEATVTHMASQDSIGSASQEHVFSVNGVPMPICTLHFPGAKSIEEAKLRASSKELRDSDYSSKFVSAFAAANLRRLYREIGQLKAAFAPPSAKPEATATCKSGVEVTIPVDEGAVYNWNKAEWTGNTALTAQELDSLLDMSAGKPANGVKLDQAPKTIEKAYGRKGYLMVRVKSTPEFDDQAQTVVYKWDVVEGPQFRMGRLITRGFSESETSRINSRWALKPGDVFDEGYRNEFTKKALMEILRDNVAQRAAQGKPMPDLNFEHKADRKTLTVDVVIEIKN